MLSAARSTILSVIDFFHKPFARWIPTQTFRYLACGGSNTVLNILLFSLSLKYVFTADKIHLFGHIDIARNVAAYVVAFGISFPIGFILSRHIVFPESNLHGRVQLFRYAMATLTFILLTYVLIKAFDVLINMMPHNASYELIHTLAYTMVNVIMAVLSYISQRKFTFKTVEEEAEEEIAV